MPESTLVKMPHCWKSHVAAQMLKFSVNVLKTSLFADTNRMGSSLMHTGPKFSAVPPSPPPRSSQGHRLRICM